MSLVRGVRKDMAVKITKTKKPKTVGQGVKCKDETDKVNGSTGPKGIPIESLIAYKQKNLTLKDMSKLLGCSEANIKKRLSGLGLETLETFNNVKVYEYDLIERKHINKLLDGESKKPMEDMTIAAIAGDKGRVIRGQATSIADHRVVTADLKDVLNRMSQAGILADTDSPDNVTDV
jgi:hypothetical protein